jgi:NAD-dependent dihydropyrimidine dehydrogenase PreA subunit
MRATINLFTYDCTGCGKCIRVCPESVLKIVYNGMTRFINTKNEEECIGCGRCEHACKNNAIKIKKYNK